MMMTDPIADLLTRVRNANMAGLEKVDVPSSKLKVEIIKILKDKGFIRSFKVLRDRKQGMIRISMKYLDGQEKVITGLKRISKPGRRIYVDKTEIPRTMGGYGITILSTSRGLLTDDICRKEGIGGEVLCSVW
ncbi:MAG: 30S ribosomal protein S8 [Nitrospira bacterium SG8_35_1]|nr:MAG: 30S ribosomal protein S8 [Nitrospira bacterium SG8_35_1]UCH46405.1 MAG: 30S ribosomal protein S8 [Nitrospiraceae bacterium]